MLKHSICFSATLLFLSLSNSVPADHAATAGYEPKYKPNFSHFDYVNPDAPKRGELVLAETRGFDSLNPFLRKGLTVGGMGLLFDTLMDKSLDEPYSIYGLIAEDIKLAEDKLSVTFRLNPCAQFSDGTPVTADDVKFSFDTLKSEQANLSYRLYWADVQQAEVLDPHTIKFHFAKVNPELHLIITELPVFSKAKVGNTPFDKITTEPLLGSGPYTVEKHALGKYITFKRNPNYWAKDLNTRRGMYNFERITYKIYQDVTVALEALKAGEFEFMVVYNSKKWALDFEGPRFASNEIKKASLPHKNNVGMQAFIFNLRRPIFQDIRVRKAIDLAFDFEWANEHLFHRQYKRCNSYFSNSELAASGLPSAEERALLEPLQSQFPEQFPKEALTDVWQPVTTNPPHSLRDNLSKAKALLTAAGWKMVDDTLQNPQGLKLSFEVLLNPNQSGFDRILASFADDLAKLGIKITYRTLDSALHQQRQDTFDFDMIVHIFGQSQSPGNELINYWHSSTAQQEGSNNVLGLKNPVVDALVNKVVYAPNRSALVTAVHALDRVLLWSWYAVPNWYNDIHRVAYWDKFSSPSTYPLYYSAEDWVPKTWWKK